MNEKKYVINGKNTMFYSYYISMRKTLKRRRGGNSKTIRKSLETPTPIETTPTPTTPTIETPTPTIETPTIETPTPIETPPTIETPPPPTTTETPPTIAETPAMPMADVASTIDSFKKELSGALSEKQQEALKEAENTAIWMGKAFLKVFNWFGIQGIDWLGFVLGFNVAGKPISKQSVPELLDSFTQLQAKLSDPRVQAKLQELIQSLLKTAETASKTGITTITDVIKDIPPLSFVLDSLDLLDGLTKTTEKVNDNLQKLLDFKQSISSNTNGFVTQENALASQTGGKKDAKKIENRILDSLNEFLH
jgi:hypothetical protein